MDENTNEWFIPKSSLRFFQSVVAKRRFYRSKIPRLENVMIEASGYEEVSIKDGYIRVWSSSILPLLRMKTGFDSSS